MKRIVELTEEEAKDLSELCRKAVANCKAYCDHETAKYWAELGQKIMLSKRVEKEEPPPLNFGG